MRSLATKVANPRTKSQLAARARFAAVGGRLKLFASALRAGFVNTGHLSPWAAAVKANWPALNDSVDQPELLMDKVVLSNGADSFDITASLSQSALDLSWTAPKLGDSFLDGAVHVAAFNSANGKSLTAYAELSNASASFDFQDLLSGSDDDLHVYYFAAAGSVSTPTVHLSA